MLTDIRNGRRAEARARGEDVVLLEIAGVRQGAILQTIYKRPDGSGYLYRGIVEVCRDSQLLRLESTIDEGGSTGRREAMVNAMRVSCGEFALGGQNADGSYQISGLLIDAYDSAFDQGALNSLSDDERLDILLPAHPLSRTRTLLKTIATSLELDAGDVASAPATPGEAVTGPRRELSTTVLRRLFAAAERFDLVEQSIEEELATPGGVASPALATAMMQLGIYHHMRDRAGNAVPMLARAESMFVQSIGDDAPPTVLARTHHAISLFKMGRHGQALPLLLRALQQIEKTPVDDGTHTLALATAAQLLVRQGNEQLAAEYLARAQKLLSRIKSE